MIEIRLVLMTLLPMSLSVILRLLEKKTSFSKFKGKDIVAGLVFGAAAVFCTEFGVDTGMAIYNTRDASVICAGLFFGWRASAVSALIGSVERYLAPLWGVGIYTRMACSIATACAGVFTSLLVKYLFENRTISWIKGFAMGAFIEVFHMLMVFVTHLNDIDKAFTVVTECSALMIFMNATGVALAIMATDLIENKKIMREKIEKVSVQLEYGLAVAMVIGFVLSIRFTSLLQSKITATDTESLLKNSISVVENDIFQGKTDLRTISKFRHVGSTGRIIISDSNGNIISDIENSDVRTLEEAGITSFDGKADVLGITSYYMSGEYNGYRIVAVLPEKEADFSSEVSIYVSIFMELLVFALLFIMLTVLVRRLILKNVDRINSDLKKITDGDLTVSLNVKSNEEFKSISDGINSTVDKLKQLIDEANARIDKELMLAKHIQSESLPCVFPPYPNRTDIDLFADMQTAKQVGGDFYDFFFASENRLFFMIADVSGKGIPAALFMMRARTLIRNLAQTGADLSDIVNRANNDLCENNDSGMFVTSWIGCLDTDTGILSYCNAGHNPPVFVSGGKAEMLRSVSGLVLAGLPGIQYKIFTRQLSAGDKVYLYTDGITEAINLSCQMFSEERLESLLSSEENRVNSSEETCEIVKYAVKQFTAGEEQFDDITMLCLKYKGKKRSIS